MSVIHEPPVDHHLVHAAPPANHERAVLATVAVFFAMLAALVFLGIVLL